MAAEVSAEADFEEDEGAVVPVEGVEVEGRIGRHSSCVDDVGGSSCSCRLTAVYVLLREGPCRDVPEGHRAFFVVYHRCPLWGESLRVYGHVDSAIPSWGQCGGWGVVEPVGGERGLLLLLL